MTDVDAALAATVEYENGTGTLATYLQDLLHTLWVEEEGFSGKRPFGNSYWQYEVYEALIQAGLIDDDDAGEQLVLAAIKKIFAPYRLPDTGFTGLI